MTIAYKYSALYRTYRLVWSKKQIKLLIIILTQILRYIQKAVLIEIIASFSVAWLCNTQITNCGCF